MSMYVYITEGNSIQQLVMNNKDSFYSNYNQVLMRDRLVL